MDALRQSLLDHKGHALVTGGTGSGKTTLALQKALKRIQEGLSSGQSVLFLSFSRAAVARIVDASKLSIPKDKRDQLTIQTFHGFFWELLRTHAYLLGTKTRLTILLPHDERALSAGVEEGDLLWPAWLKERERLFQEEGRIPFDFFAPRAAELIQRSAIIRNLITEKHPLIIVDEAQDTNPDAWRCIEILSAHTQIVCLADLEQQIFDHLPGIGPERIEAIKNALNPLLIELGTQNHRSPNSEIVLFARNILTGRISGDPYRGVSALSYDPNPKRVQIAKVVRSAHAILQHKIKAETGAFGKRVAILLPSGAAAARLSGALNAAEKLLRHKLLFDEAEAMLAARFAAFFLEPVHNGTANDTLAKGLELLSEMRRGAGAADAAQLKMWADKSRSGKVPRAGFVTAIQNLIVTLHAEPWTGDPGKDWLRIKRQLRETKDPKLAKIARHLDYLIAFNRGKRITANLSEAWRRDGLYTNARDALQLALVQDQLADGIDDPDGIQVMTIHKSKGKQFDGVIIVREPRHDGVKWVSSLLWRDDVPPYARSRKILHVAITRAKTQVLMLNPAYPNCPILSGHRL